MTGNKIRIPIKSVTRKIPLGVPEKESAIAPMTGAIMGAIPIMAVTLESD